MILLLFFASLFISFVSSAPGYDLHGLGIYSPPIIKAAPLLPAAPILSHAPIFEHAPIIKAPIYAPVPHVPIIKTIVPATSYATVTQYHVSHPVKTIIAAPPIIKYAAPISLGHGYGYH